MKTIYSFRLLWWFMHLFIGGISAQILFIPAGKAQTRPSENLSASTSTISSSVRLHGVVKEQASNASVPFATVALRQGSATIPVKGTITDTAGRFVLENIRPGSYILEISYLGYRKFVMDPLTIESGSPEANIGQIQLQSEVNQLKEIKVVGNKPFIERVENKFILNVANSVVGSGASAIEVLERAPGVFIGGGNVSVQGKPALILVDGKAIQLSGESLADFLKGFSSDNILTIEIITEPSAKYDASAGAVINIRTKKGLSEGLNGTANFSLGSSIYPKYTAGTSFNYRKNAINVFGSYNYGNNISMRRRRENSLFQSEQSSSPLQALETNGEDKTSGQTHTTRLGIDYQLARKHVVGLTADVNFYKQNINGSSTTGFITPPVTTDSILQTSSQRHTDHSLFIVNLNYKGSFGKSGNTLETNIDYGRDSYQSTSEFRGNITIPESASTHFSQGLQNLPNYSIWFTTYKLDYEQSLPGKIMLEAGAKTTFAKTDNRLQINTRDSEETNWKPDPRSNIFLYEENINAIYLNLKKEIHKWNINVGARVEQTRAKIHSVTSNQLINRNYANLFPNVSLWKDLSKKHRTSFSFTGGLRRPSYNNLNPFLLYTNQYIYYQGNPYLNPEINYRFSISHTYNKKITTTLNYFISRNLFYETLEQEPNSRITRYFYDNLAQGHTYGININFPIQFTDWWESSNNVFASYGKTRDNNFLGIQLNEASYGMYINTSHQFSLPHGFKLDLTATYLSTYRFATNIQLPNLYANAGFQKEVLKQAATIRVVFNDIFWSRLYRYQTHSAVQNQEGRNYTDSRMIRAAFTYRFGNKNVLSRKRSKGSEEEKSRALNE